MNKTLPILIAAVSATCLAAPTLKIDAIDQNPDSRIVSITYTISGEPAVVTLDGITAGGQALDEATLADVQGDVNKLIPVDSGHRIYWKPDETVKGADYTTASFSVTAWATNAPPDYMVIDLSNKIERVHYYTSTNRFPVPLSDASYRTTKLVMRRIPAAGVTFRMGSPTDETGRQSSENYEATHYVKLTNDFYIGIYPVTRRQHLLLTGKSPAQNAFAAYGEADDWPVTGVQLCALRTWLVEQGAAATHKYWPRDGHELDYDSGHANNGNLLYYMRQNFPGFLFDLPTEAQWEFACRGGATEYEVRPGEVDEVAWTTSNSLSATYGVYLPHPVGQLRPNGYGLYDMLGNVWEKMLDAWDVMPNGDAVLTDPPGPDKGIARGTYFVMRGGAFSCAPGQARSANRLYASINNLLDTFAVADHSAANNGNKYTYGYRLWLPAEAVK